MQPAQSSINRPLAHRLRLEAVAQDALELAAEVSARIIHSFWKKSRSVDVRPETKSMGFKVFVNNKKVAEVSHGGRDGDCMRPCVVIEAGGQLMGFESTDEAVATLTEMIEKELTTTDEHKGN